MDWKQLNMYYIEAATQKIIKDGDIPKNMICRQFIFIQVNMFMYIMIIK